jgi:hypothetical protein
MATYSPYFAARSAFFHTTSICYRHGAPQRSSPVTYLHLRIFEVVALDYAHRNTYSVEDT